MVKEDILHKQENLMNSNKQSGLTIKNTLIPEEPCTPYQNPPLSVAGGTNKKKHDHDEFLITKGKGYKQI